jgi:hypothetical protein
MFSLHAVNPANVLRQNGYWLAQEMAAVVSQSSQQRPRIKGVPCPWFQILLGVDTAGAIEHRLGWVGVEGLAGVGEVVGSGVEEKAEGYDGLRVMVMVATLVNQRPVSHCLRHILTPPKRPLRQSWLTHRFSLSIVASSTCHTFPHPFTHPIPHTHIHTLHDVAIQPLS